MTSEKSFVEDISIKKLMQVVEPYKQKCKHDESGRFMPNMDMAILRKDPIIQEWLTPYPKRTQDTYRSMMNVFLNASGQRPKDLVGMEAPDLKRLTKSVMGALVQKNRPYAAVGIMHAMKSFANHYEKPIKFGYGEKI